MKLNINIFRKKNTIDDQGKTFSASNIRSWYQEQYETIIVHRNIAFIICGVFLLMLGISLITTIIVVNSRRFDPFVVQIDEKQGMAQVIRQTAIDDFSASESLARFFIKRYLTARETYNIVDFADNVRRTVRLLSTQQIFVNYLNYIKNPDFDPISNYGDKNTTYITIKSWSRLSDSKYIVRFSITETSGGKRVFNKIAVIDFRYVPMELTEQDSDINPIGFQVTGYRVDDDNS